MLERALERRADGLGRAGGLAALGARRRSPARSWPGPVAGGLGAVAAGRHVAPAPPAGARGVVEDPAARVVVADPDALGVAGGQLRTSGSARRARASSIGSPTWRWSTRDAVGRRDELDDLAGVERAVDGRRARRRAARAARRSHGRPRAAPRGRAWMRASSRAAAAGSLGGLGARRSAPSTWMTPRSTNQVERRVERRQIRSTGKPSSSVVGVQEVEGALERRRRERGSDRRRESADWSLSLTTLYRLTGYAQGGTVH